MGRGEEREGEREKGGGGEREREDEREMGAESALQLQYKEKTTMAQQSAGHDNNYEILTYKRFKRTLINHYDADTQSAKFRGNHLCQATKRHFNNSETVKNDEK